ncbi:Holliday junction resolvase RuvX [Oleiagrimonas sp. C23AA]|uniref:Holliday junction resolvase RuvX n=1 Tax=Oleiagrimonas sp. C23AA TaxID=2719047 RepID=UPI0014224F0E|nr:Holliday junction resolvase RuvX [Oleiagrimonas sp. C23AA]NII11994.1 Holliday junction resolvase RuvX [Oleiagrimonas sp. C23AA]
MSCVLGFDVGTRLIGVAIGNRITGDARALTVVPMRDKVPDWEALDRLMRDWQPQALVVGLPLALDGSRQPMTRTARRFGAELRTRYGINPDFADERHSSQEAAQRFARQRKAGLKRRRDGAKVDAEAAAVIVETWLSGLPPTPLS